MTVSIEGGCTYLGDDYWEYRWTDVEGDHSEVFYSVIKPKIGDTIEGGMLMPLIGYKINHDVSRWINDPYDEWPEK